MGRACRHVLHLAGDQGDDLADGHVGIDPFPGKPTFVQLQYSQLSILIFNGVLWPHINVATLRLSAG